MGWFVPVGYGPCDHVVTKSLLPFAQSNAMSFSRSTRRPARNTRRTIPVFDPIILTEEDTTLQYSSTADTEDGVWVKDKRIEVGRKGQLPAEVTEMLKNAGQLSFLLVFLSHPNQLSHPRLSSFFSRSLYHRFSWLSGSFNRVCNPGDFLLPSHLELSKSRSILLL